MSGKYFVKKPCKHCPFRKDVKPFLHPERAEDLAYATCNPYNSFPCHKTLGENEEDGDTMVIETSKECAGFLSMQVNYGATCPDGFTPSLDVYEEPMDMAIAYEEQWELEHKKIKNYDYRNIR